MSSYENLLGGPPPTLLPADPAASLLGAPSLDEAADPADLARRYPESSLAWAVLAEQALARGRDVEGYAYARVGYHRGLDALRRSGWKGHGPVPWDHEPNQGFLRALHALGRAAEAIGEPGEPARIRSFLDDCDPDAAMALG